MREAAKLTDHQRQFLEKHAASLPGPLRDAFRRTVVSRLTGVVADGAVAAAVVSALSNVSIGDMP